MKRVLVLGGTGFVGRQVCARLAARGWEVTVPTRQPAQARALQVLPLLQAVQANVHDGATLARLVAGQDAVVNLVAILHGTPQAFEQVHVKACPVLQIKAAVEVGSHQLDKLVAVHRVGGHAVSLK